MNIRIHSNGARTQKSVYPEREYGINEVFQSAHNELNSAKGITKSTLAVLVR